MEIPSNWERVLLKSVCDVLDSRRIPVNSSQRLKRIGTVPYYGATGQVGWIDNHLFDEEIVLLGEDGAPFFDKSKPIAYIVRGKSWVNNHAHVIRAIEGITFNPYLKYFLDQFDFADYVNGTTRLKLTQEAMNRIPIPLAPLNEQRRIVEKLNELMGRLAAARAKLERVPRLLSHFRRAVLAAACSGALTRDWRLENEEVEEWRTTKVADLFDRGGIFDGPFGSNLKSSDYTSDGVRVIRLENIGYLDFLGGKQTFISEEKYETLKRHTVGEGDLIFSSFIADNVRCCVLPKLETLAVAKADCFCLRPKPELVDVHFLQFQLSTRDSYDLLVENVHGATRPRINTTQLKNLEIPLPPLAEQREIVRRVNELFALADSLEARFHAAKAFFDRLPAAILAKAFRGELVPQNPDDEPAALLLQRLASARDAAGPARKTPSVREKKDTKARSRAAKPPAQTTLPGFE